MKRFSPALKNALSAVCVIVMLALALYGVNKVLILKNSSNRYGEFWEDPGAYDVWLMGNSHMYYGVQPMELWENYGYTSYNLASPSCFIPTNYWVLRCALEKGTPKLIVLDTYQVHQNGKYFPRGKVVHTALDSVPMSLTKLKAIHDLFDEKESRVEYAFPLYIYHNRWDELTLDELTPNPTATKGAFFKDKRSDVSELTHVSKKRTLSEETMGMEYLRRIIELCQKENIPLILTGWPCYVSKSAQAGLNSAKALAEAYGVPFLNPRYDESILDDKIDFADKGHVNPSGSQKLTLYLGDYLQENTDLPDHRNDPETAREWNKDFEAYMRYLTRKMAATKKLMPYLLWLRDESFTTYVYARETKPINNTYEMLFANISDPVYVDQEEMEELLGRECVVSYAFLVVTEDGTIVDSALFDKTVRIMTEPVEDIPEEVSNDM